VSELDTELAEMFVDEATGRLDAMDAALLAIESGEAGAGAVGELFRHAHTIKGAAGMLGYSGIRELAHAMEDVLASARESGQFPPSLAASLLRATGALRAQVTGQAGATPAGLLGELAASQRVAAQATPPAGPPGTPPGPAEADGRPAAPSTAPAGQPAEAKRVLPEGAAPGQVPGSDHDGRRPEAGAGAARRTVRVPAVKIDHLLDVVGEVMQDRRRLLHALGGGPDLPRSLDDQLAVGGRMLEELRDLALGMRMLPLSAITGPLPRAVRDLARQAGKEVRFTVTGADTELDRVILENLSQPLGHLLRNSVTHGIEPPGEREQAGKPRRGHIELRALSRGRMVEITVFDDGRGVPAEVLAEAGREGSLADLLARPGYSTATEVTDLAGRGVGLDVVKAQVESLGGSFGMHSQPGQGMTVRLLLPVALTVLDVLLFERAGAVYGVPLAAVEEAVQVATVQALQGRAAFDLRGWPVPVEDVAGLLGADAPALPQRPPGLVVSAGGRRTVVTCDELLGQQEVVVKPLGPLLAAVPGYLGAAILGDGRIALVLEPAALTRVARHRGGQAGTPARAPVPRILVAEDAATVRELQRAILEAAGYPVVTAPDGRAALAALAQDPRIALVLTDLEMPGLDGLSLARAIRADPARACLPVVILSSRASEADHRLGIEAGANAYLTKQGFSQQVLLETVERLVGRAAGGHPPAGRSQQAGSGG
jgi:two-component system chemotaxis sensor kinase CheA